MFFSFIFSHKVIYKYVILKKYILCGPYCMNLYSKRRWQRWHHGRRQPSQQPVGGEEVPHSPTPKWGIRRSRWAKQLWMYVLNSWPPCYLHILSPFFCHSLLSSSLCYFVLFLLVCFFQPDNFWYKNMSWHMYVMHVFVSQFLFKSHYFF